MATSPNLIVAIVFALLTVASSHVYFEERFEGNHTFLSSLLIFRCTCTLISSVPGSIHDRVESFRFFYVELGQESANLVTVCRENHFLIQMDAW